MNHLFPEPIRSLPQADMPFHGVNAYLSQSDTHQIIFMEFTEDVILPEHSHAGQWAVVLDGRIDLAIGGSLNTYKKGDTYFIPEGVKHSGKIYAGYADITYFNQRDRYQVTVQPMVPQGVFCE